MDDNDVIVESWVSNAKAWTEAVRSNKVRSRVAGTNAAILRVIGSRLPCRVLDVGCGEGWLSHELSRFGFNVVGIDASLELLQSAQDGLATFLHLSYREFSSDPSLIDGTFDRIVCNYSLFEEDLQPLLLALRSKLSPEGILIIQTMHPSHIEMKERNQSSGWRSEDFSSVGPNFRASMPFYFRTIEDWRIELSHAKLQLIECLGPLHPVSGAPLSLIMLAHAHGPSTTN